MSLLALLSSRLGVLLRRRGVLLALRMIAPAVVLSCSAMKLSRVFVMLGGLIVFVLRHWISSNKFSDWLQ
jgi:hypothetical protein